MDGIVPILFMFIMLGLLICGLLSIAQVILFINYKKRSIKISERFTTIAIVNVALMAMVTLFTLIGANTVIGYSPLIYISPMLFLASAIILIAIKANEKSNKAI